MKRAIILGLAVWGFLFAAATARAEPIRFGILPVIDTLPLQVADKEGLFAKHGLELSLVPFSSALERDTAMRAGQLDGYFGDMIASLMLVNSGVPLRVVTVSYRSTPGQPMFGLVTSPAMAGLTVDTLSGKSVGLSESTIIEYVLDLMENDLGLAHGAMERVEVKKLPIRLQMLLGDQIDTALLPEPLLSLGKAKGGTVLATDENLDVVLTVLCLDSEALAGDGVLQKFLAAYQEAVGLLNSHPEDYRDLLVSGCRVPKPMAGDFPIYRFSEPSLPEPAQVRAVVDWMIGKGLLPMPIQYSKVVAEP